MLHVGNGLAAPCLRRRCLCLSDADRFSTRLEGEARPDGLVRPATPEQDAQDLVLDGARDVAVDHREGGPLGRLPDAHRELLLGRSEDHGHRLVLDHGRQAVGAEHRDDVERVRLEQDRQLAAGVERDGQRVPSQPLLLGEFRPQGGSVDDVADEGGEPVHV